MAASESSSLAATKLHILADSGAPPGSNAYTTLVLIHGFTMHSGIFTTLLPLAPAHNARILLLNRRDYPGSAPYNEAELAPLNAAGSNPDRELLQEYMAARAQELADLLSRFVHDAAIPLRAPREEITAVRETGGIVLVGWSFGTCLMTAFLAHIACGTNTSPAARHLRPYIRRVIFHDTPYHTLGFPPIPDPYNPLTDPALAPSEKTRVFAAWVSGYYAHDLSDSDSEGTANANANDPDRLERRTPLAAPPPTLSTLTDAERTDIFCPGPGDPGGSDSLLLGAGIQSGLFAELRDRALRLPASQSPEAGADSCAAVEVRHVWCDRSVWEMPWSVWNMRAAIEEERKAGVRLRNLTFLRLRGANHFVHWDEPERALKAFLLDMSENEDTG